MATVALSSLSVNDLAAGLPVLDDGAGGGLVLAVLAVVVVFILVRAVGAILAAVAAVLGPLLLLGAALAVAFAIAVALMGGVLNGDSDSRDPPAPEPEVVAPVACGG
ncbi:MAG TPA: hypothetical protein VK908_03930 [Jiangellales bacterium]|nr:hypothetical protein [Jiangellales bacterium]